MCENTRGRVTFLVNLILSRLEKFDLSMLGWGGGGEGRGGWERVRIYGVGLIFEMLIGFQISGVYFPVGGWGAYILGDVLTGFCDIWEILER